MAAIPNSDGVDDFRSRLLNVYGLKPDSTVLESLTDYTCYGCGNQVGKPASALVYQHFIYVITTTSGGPDVQLRILCAKCAQSARFVGKLGKVVGFVL